MTPPSRTGSLAVRSGRITSGFSSALASQLITSGMNFLAVIVASHRMPASELGVFLLIYSVVVFGVGLIQAVCCEAVTVSVSAEGLRLDEKVRISVLRTVLVSASVSALLMLLAAFVGPVELSVPLVVAALLLTPYASFDSNRALLLASMRATQALRWDVLVCAASVGALFLVFSGILPSRPEVLICCVMVPASLAGLFYLFQAARGDAERDLPVGLWQHRRNLGLEFFSIQGSVQIALFLVASFLGLSQLAALRAVQTLFGPLNILFNVVRITYSARLARGINGLPPKRALMEWFRIAGFVILCSGLAVLFVAAISAAFGFLLLGQTWEHASNLLTAMTVQYLALALVNASVLATRAAMRTDLSLICRTGQGIAVLVAVIVSVHIEESARSVAIGIAVATCAAAIVWVGVAVWALNRPRGVRLEFQAVQSALGRSSERVEGYPR